MHPTIEAAIATVNLIKEVAIILGLSATESEAEMTLNELRLKRQGEEHCSL